MINELIFAGVAFFHPPVPMDSIGIETVNGKIFILHQIEEKETLYAVSRRYGVAVDVILQHNPTAGSGLNIGQIIKVPYAPKRTAKADGTTHVVAAKETMFSLSQMYGISIDEIKQWNGLTSNALSVGQELIVRQPAGAPKPAIAAATTGGVVKPAATGTHIVAPKETMYSISRQYNITVQELKDWNTIEGNDISIGQELAVAAPRAGQTPAHTATAGTATPSAATTGPPVSANAGIQTGTGTAPVQSSTAPSAATSAPQKKADPQSTAGAGIEQTVTISETVKSADEILETGLAELIEGTEGNRKYLALHRTAPAGTILKVRNEMNNREVFVRVMGRLPDNALSNKLVIKISKSAYERLGAIDPRFRVEVTYYK